MELTTVWFVLIAVLWSGYFVLEGFDFGVGILLPVIGKTESERRTMLTTLGPVWDGNEVWLIVAGGATFAAFPQWYATLFSGFYLPLLLILVALIIRGVSFEYRSKRSSVRWRKNFDIAIVVGSFLPALLWGVAFANLVRGVPLRLSESTNMVTGAATVGGSVYDGGFFNLLNPYALLGGLVTLTLFLTQGCLFLALKTTGDLRERAVAQGKIWGLVAAVLAVTFLLWTQLAYSDKTWTWALVVIGALAWVAGIAMHWLGRDGWAFVFSSVTLVGAVAFLFSVLFPYLMQDRDNPIASLTVANASSSDYTLKVMTIVAIIFTPIVLIYQAWTYWVFRKRISADAITNPEAGSLDLPSEVEKSVGVS